jgi:hypothetical protein
MSEWLEEARKNLLGLQDGTGGWGYRRNGLPSVEPTALACLALRATDPDGGAGRLVEPAAKWLASLQQPDGSVGLFAGMPRPEWPTPFALLLWADLGGFDREIQHATEWLLERRGLTFKKSSVPGAGHDASIAGWPWIAETHSWLEPTAMAVLALRRVGKVEHQRTQDGLRLIRDRAIATGGWNYGNNAVYGTNLRAQPASTGIALAALSGTQGRDGVVDRACSYLRSVLPGIRSAQSLGWGLLGLAAWDEKLPESGTWLSEAFGTSTRRREAAPQISYLLLAAGGKTLALLGARR